MVWTITNGQEEDMGWEIKGIWIWGVSKLRADYGGPNKVSKSTSKITY